jgi:ADP-ribose pyrophosphatase
VIVERQYKHGPAHMVLTLPAGAVDPGEAPLAAAKRELLEETGYAAAEWHPLGSYTANGNYGCGCAHIYLARGCVKTAEPTSDDLEHTTLLTLTNDELMRLTLSGRIDLIGNVAAVMLAAAKLRELA